MSCVLSVNLARPHAADYTAADVTGIDKRPVTGAVAVAAPKPSEQGGSGLHGDVIGDARYHGGEHQAVYAYAREDLDRWERELQRELPGGTFGENLTTSGVDVGGALIGERWRIGSGPVLEVTSPRIPCRTFAGWLGEQGWVKRFTEAALPGAYLRVIEPGEIRAADSVVVEHRPEHEVTVALTFRAVTTAPELLPRVLTAGAALAPDVRDRAVRRTS